MTDDYPIPDMDDTEDELRAEIDRLQHDIDRHIGICASLATENEKLRWALEVARKWMPVSPAYTPEGRADIDLVEKALAKED